MADVIEWIVASPGYLAVILFVGAYPIVIGSWWIAASLMFALKRERHDLGSAFYQLDEHPPVSILLAARNEEVDLPATVEALERLDWPDVEIVIVDDASTDGTNAILSAFADQGRLRLITKVEREGKAMALNDALPFVSHEIILLLDADARPAPDVLRWSVPHIVRLPRVAAVALNPRVANVCSVVTALQAVEFSSTISVTRRAQALWGRLMTISGVSVLARRTLIERAGRWDPSMATEDIAMTWQLQEQHLDVRYEPQAVVQMRVPESFGDLWRQRMRWGRGLIEVLQRDQTTTDMWASRRTWPLIAEAVLSIVWAHLLVALMLLWAISLAVGGPAGAGSSPIPTFWGLIVLTVAMVQVMTGMLLEHRHDGGARQVVLYAVWFPLAYWMFNSLVVVRVTLPTLLQRRRATAVTWQSPTRT